MFDFQSYPQSMLWKESNFGAAYLNMTFPTPGTEPHPVMLMMLFFLNVESNANCFYVRHPETHTFYHYYKNKGVKNVRFYAGFPKHSFDRIKTLIELGLGSKEPVNYKGKMIRPVDFLTQVLKRIKVPEGYKETENLWVHIFGKKDGKKKEIKMECVINTLKGWEEDYTNIDTGMPISIIAQMIKKGIIKEKGVFSPEGVVPPEPFFKELKRRKMKVYENGKRIN